MKITSILFIGILFLGSFYSLTNWNCIWAQQRHLSPDRLVIIKGQVLYLNHPTLGVTPATTETLIFQKTDCGSCYIAATPDSNGNYKILVGDGKYRLIVENPSPPEVDLLAPGQERIIDTQTDEALGHSQTVFNLDVKLRLPK
jgi:hypothetical protein